MRHGGKILIDQLEAHGATIAFTVPGESFLAALDGLHDFNRIKTIICRQEGGASMMAEAWGKITGEPGVLFVTRGPGAANAMSGLHVAKQDSTPMLTFVGMPARDTEDREAFQEIEVKQLFSSFVKWAAVIRDTQRIPEYVSHAVHVARSGRARPRRAGPAGGHAGSRVRDCRRQVCTHRRAAPGRRRPRPAAGEAHESRAAADDHRRARLERGVAEIHPGVRRALRHGGRAGLPLPGLLRQPASLLRRLRRHRHRCEARGCREGRRPADRHRRAARRDDDQRLHAPRHPQPEAVPGARPSLARRAGLGLPPRSADRGRPPAPSSRRSPGSSRRRRSPGAAAAPSCARPTSRAASRSSCPAR